ncbi:2-dehydropantoate 2-reductase [Shewanella alkalitolerans]|uniref:ketopantoate reductase family protein n=1 Tax=Shewanella alkalitolerans TaxID=2864209 RepID=UPI001C65D03C|nr:2-dehydropantoate 2-reductase [Shewanella alkalitolerans]QYJ96795.1 2-dehydropantoate 2-reductase [Shewanella alkalitolerans]
MTTSDMTHASKIVILGAGAIGQLIFHQLSAYGVTPALLGRDASADSQTLEFTNLEGETVTRQAQFIDKSMLASCELLIVCVKAYQVEAALLPLLDALPTDTHILLLHNGLGPHLSVAPHLAGRGLSLGTTSQGALKLGRWQIRQTGAGLTQVGHAQGPRLADNLRQALLGAIHNSEWCEPILPMLWQKLAINIAINPLTAINDCRNGELAGAKFTPTIHALVQEVVAVANADGIALDQAQLTERVYQVIQLTASNYSSMHQDIHHGRQTEIEAITGYLLSRAAEYGVATPANEAIYRQLKSLERGD